MTTPKPREGGIQYWGVDWTAQCEAKCRKTGERCPHTCDSQIPSLIAGRTQMDASWFSIQGRPVNLCRGHYRSWHARARRLLTLPLIDGGHLSPGNRFAYGSIVIMADRIDFEKEDGNIKVRIPPAWGWVSWRGNVLEGMLERIPHYEKPTAGFIKEVEGRLSDANAMFPPDPLAQATAPSTPASPALARIREYLWTGGTWNPELMEHDKVRDLIILCRDELQKAHDEATCAMKDWVPGEAMRYDLHSVRGGHVFAWLSSPIPQSQVLCCVICKKPQHELFPTLK